jgi:hypothetical protein
VFALSPTGIGEAGTACFGQTFHITAIDPATGQYTFTPTGGPVVLTTPATPNSTCRVDFTFDVLKAPTKDSDPAAPGIQTAQIAFATGTSSSTGASNQSSGFSSISVDKASSNLVTQASTNSASVAPGTTVTDQATLAPAPGGPAPTGTVTYTLVGPNPTATCTGPVVGTGTAPVGSPSTGFTVTSPGTYNFVATYSGDANYSPITTPVGCGVPNETFTVARPPSLIDFLSGLLHFVLSLAR